MKKILGIGSTLVDILSQVPNEEVLNELNLPKGSMTYVNINDAVSIGERLAQRHKVDTDDQEHRYKHPGQRRIDYIWKPSRMISLCYRYVHNDARNKNTDRRNNNSDDICNEYTSIALAYGGKVIGPAR